MPSTGQVANIGILHKFSGKGAQCEDRFCRDSGMISQTSCGLLPLG